MEAIALLIVIIMWFLLNRKIKELSERVIMLEGENNQVVKQINVMLEDKKDKSNA
ncbi:hypothetical protein OAQ47_01845 [Paracoccaceae bacterium]|nr:hypothetical protein [Paracoccaceae bacterium]